MGEHSGGTGRRGRLRRRGRRISQARRSGQPGGSGGALDRREGVVELGAASLRGRFERGRAAALDDLPGAIGTAAAATGDANRLTDSLEVGTAQFDASPDFGLGHRITDADDHGKSNSCMSCRTSLPTDPVTCAVDRSAVGEHCPIEIASQHRNLAGKPRGSPPDSPTDIPRDIGFDIAPRGTIINGNHSHLQWPPSSKCDFCRKIGWQTDKRWHFSAPGGRRHGLVPVEGSPRPTRFPFR